MISTDMAVRTLTRADADEIVSRATAAGLNTDVRDTFDATARPFEVKVHGLHDGTIESVLTGIDCAITSRVDNEVVE